MNFQTTALNFQLTTSRRGRRDNVVSEFYRCCFSTHDLTQRSTKLHGIYYSPPFFSTHDLTQRSTGVSSHQPFILSFFNSRPHAEVDRMGHIQYGTMILFNSRPHAEVDQNRINLWTQLAIFNSRPHAEVDKGMTDINPMWRIFQLTTSRRGRPDGACFVTIMVIFQLTTSRRGRLSVFPLTVSHLFFNSRPHAEVDRNAKLKRMFQ